MARDADHHPATRCNAAIIAGWLLAFTLSLDDLVIASFTTGPGATTLPMRIYSAVRLGVSPEINAISTCSSRAWRHFSYRLADLKREESCWRVSGCARRARKSA